VKSHEHTDVAPLDLPTITSDITEDVVYDGFSHFPARQYSLLLEAERLRPRTPEELSQLHSLELHTRRYLEAGLITEEDLDENGLYTNEYSDRSTYIYATSARKEATSRYIVAEKPPLLSLEPAIMSLPTAKHFSLDTELVKIIADVQRLSDIGPRDVIEVSGLASDRTELVDTNYGGLDATRVMYAKILRHSLESGHKLWLMNVDEELKDKLSKMLGEDNVVQLGDKEKYMGDPTVPIGLNPYEVVKSILKSDDPEWGPRNRRYLQATFQGISRGKLPRELSELMKANDIETTPGSPWSAMAKHKLAIGASLIMGYSTLRAVPLAVGAIQEFDGDALIFANLDVTTAAGQLGAMERYLNGRNRAERLLGGVAAIACLYAPYLYVWGHGGTASPVVNGIAGTLTGGAIIMEVRKSIKDARTERGLYTSDLPDEEITGSPIVEPVTERLLVNQ
jgi:hypothetical protein